MDRCQEIIDGRKCRWAAGHSGKHTPLATKERLIIGKISHWGRVSHRSHLLVARVPLDYKLGEIFRVKILSVPDCVDCGKGAP